MVRHAEIPKFSALILGMLDSWEAPILSHSQKSFSQMGILEKSMEFVDR